MTSFSKLSTPTPKNCSTKFMYCWSPMNLPPGKRYCESGPVLELAAEVVVGDLEAEAVGLAHKNSALHLLLADAIR